MVAAALAPWAMGLTGWLYGVTALALNAVFLALAVGVALNRASEPAGMAPEKRLFKFSILYLFLLFTALVADRLVPA
jgi:protoheme IX farnesyltransferase